MDAVDLERVGDNVGDTIKTLATHHTAETAGMVALTTRSQDLGGGRRGEGEEGINEGLTIQVNACNDQINDLIPIILKGLTHIMQAWIT
jgi:hypothetical protein